MYKITICGLRDSIEEEKKEEVNLMVFSSLSLEKCIIRGVLWFESTYNLSIISLVLLNYSLQSRGTIPSRELGKLLPR